MVADLARRVGGDRIDVVVLMGPGVDPHLYKATPGDVRALESADIVFSSGLHLEGKLGELLEKLGERKPVVAVTSVLEHEKLMSDKSGAHDPHVWFDVSLWAQALAPVRDTLTRHDPAHATAYGSRTEESHRAFTALHDQVREIIATIPKEQRVLVTAHDAFGYFGRAYDVEVLAVQGMSTESEASLKDVNDLVATLVDRRIPAIFVESSVSPKNIQALVEGAAARGHSVRIGGELYSDAMGASGTPEGTYEGMVLHNARTITRALVGVELHSGGSP
jgi:manganese/zinc/iron transport system substrate-binding protein